MSKLWCLGAVVLVLFGAGLVRADDPKQPKVERIGPIEIEIQAEAQAVPGQQPERAVKILLNGKPVELKGDVIKWIAKPQNLGQLLGEPVNLGEYWLGLACGPVDEKARQELKLPEGQGVLVEHVVPDSPAAKAGFKPKDVLTKAADKTLKGVEDLVDVVNQVKDKPLKIELLRAGRQETITVTPAKRPEGVLPGATVPRGADWEQIQKWFERWQVPGEGKGEAGPLQFRIFGPGMILPPGAPLPHDVFVQPPLPDDMTITISKTGKQPTKITVKQGDEKWEVTEKELDKLPAKVRPHVERMLGRMPLGAGAAVFSFSPGEGKPLSPKIITERIKPLPPQGSLEKRFDELNQRIDKLTKMVEELKAATAKPKKAPKERPKDPSAKEL